MFLHYEAQSKIRSLYEDYKNKKSTETIHRLYDDNQNVLLQIKTMKLCVLCVCERGERQRQRKTESTHVCKVEAEKQRVGERENLKQSRLQA